MADLQTSYDYVIVGGGSAGCVLAARLSEDADVTVLLLEAGPPDRGLMMQIPACVYSVYHDRSINWNGRVANTSGGSYHPAKAGIFMLC